jgi:cobalamin biosynthesis protein CbiG
LARVAGAASVRRDAGDGRTMKPEFWIGIGCQRHTSSSAIARAITQVCQAHDIPEATIAGIATIDRKANESGLVDYCRDRQLPLCGFSADQLSRVSTPSPSDRVKDLVGSPSVAEAAAILAAAIGAKLWVPKQVVRDADGGTGGGVTVAIASRFPEKSWIFLKTPVNQGKETVESDDPAP